MARAEEMQQALSSELAKLYDIVAVQVSTTPKTDADPTNIAAIEAIREIPQHLNQQVSALKAGVAREVGAVMANLDRLAYKVKYQADQIDTGMQDI